MVARIARPEPALPVRFSLLVCTLGRVMELERLLESLRAQSYRNFEVVLVDQNADARLDPLLRRFAESLSIRRIRSARGISRGRNAGLPHCQGDIIGLPDDDCWYPPGLLESVAQAFSERPQAGFVFGRWRDENDRDALGPWPESECAATRQLVWTRAISFTIFLRRAAVLRVGPFDERLGVGADTPWGAGEETDYVLRAMSAGIRGWHYPDCVVHHPSGRELAAMHAAARALSYGRGIGFVLGK